MKKIILLLLSLVLIFTLMSCDAGDSTSANADATTDTTQSTESTNSTSTDSSSATQPSGDPEPTDPEPTDPEPTDPEPTDPEPTDPEPTDPEPTDPEPTDPEPADPEPTDPEPTDPEPTDPEPEPEPEPDPEDSNNAFLEDFMADHDAGQKFTVYLDDNTYEISVNPDTGICTVIHWEDIHHDWITLTPYASYPFGSMTTTHSVFYYRGTYNLAPDQQTYQCQFTQRHAYIAIDGMTNAISRDIREYVWDHIYMYDWQEIWLTQKECEFWDAILDGYIMPDPRSCIDTLEITGQLNADIPVSYINYYDYLLECLEQEIIITPEYVRHNHHAGDGYCSYREYTHNGTLLAWGNSSPYGDYSRDEFDDQRRMIFSSYRDAEGLGADSYFVYEDGFLTRTIYRYEFDEKTNSITLQYRTIDIFRYDPENPAAEAWVSSHTYDNNDRIVQYSLYNEDGKLVEFYQEREGGGTRQEFYTYENGLLFWVEVYENNELIYTQEYIYEDGKLIKDVYTAQHGTTTTREYIYENGQPVKIIVTIVHPDGTIEQWEEDYPTAAPPASPP